MAARKRSTRANGSSVTKRPKAPASERIIGQPSAYEWRRKILHSSIGFFAIAGIRNGVAIPQIVHGLSGALVIIVSADLLRFRSPAFERTYESVLGWLMRPKEKRGWNGVIFYLLGCILVLTLFPVDIGVFAIVLLSWCDTSASLVGRTFGKYTPALPTIFAQRKSVAGTSAAIAVGIIAARYFFSSVPAPSWALSPVRTQLPAHSTARPFPPIARLPAPQSTLSFDALTILCGLVGGVAEALEIFGLDDNLSLPVLSAVLLYTLLWALG